MLVIVEINRNAKILPECFVQKMVMINEVQDGEEENGIVGT